MINTFKDREPADLRYVRKLTDAIESAETVIKQLQNENFMLRVRHSRLFWLYIPAAFCVGMFFASAIFLAWLGFFEFIF